MRLIDADKLEIFKITDKIGDRISVYGVTADDIANAPTVDAIVSPVKVGQTVYRVCKKKYDVDGYGMQWEEDMGIVTNAFHLGMLHEIGKTVFLTREAAEEALKARENEKNH